MQNRILEHTTISVKGIQKQPKNTLNAVLSTFHITKKHGGFISHAGHFRSNIYLILWFQRSKNKCMEHYWFSSILISSKQGTDINRNLIPQMLLQRILLPTLLFLLLLHNKQPRTVPQSLDKGIRHRVCFDWTRWSYFQQILRRSRVSGEIHKSCLILAKGNDDISFSLLQIDCYCFGFSMSLDNDQTRLSSVDLIGDIFPRRWVLCNKRTRVSIPLVGGAPTPRQPFPPSSLESGCLPACFSGAVTILL